MTKRKRIWSAYVLYGLTYMKTCTHTYMNTYKQMHVHPCNQTGIDTGTSDYIIPFVCLRNKRDNRICAYTRLAIKYWSRSGSVGLYLPIRTFILDYMVLDVWMSVSEHSYIHEHVHLLAIYRYTRSHWQTNSYTHTQVANIWISKLDDKVIRYMCVWIYTICVCVCPRANVCVCVCLANHTHTGLPAIKRTAYMNIW